MNIVEHALEQVKDGVLPVTRHLNCYELSVLREIAEKTAASMPGGLDGNLVFEAIGKAYAYGFWQGWKHCEVERPEFEEFDADEDPADEDPADLGSDDSNEEVEA